MDNHRGNRRAGNRLLGCAVLPRPVKRGIEVAYGKDHPRRHPVTPGCFTAESGIACGDWWAYVGHPIPVRRAERGNGFTVGGDVANVAGDHRPANRAGSEGKAMKLTSALIAWLLALLGIAAARQAKLDADTLHTELDRLMDTIRGDSDRWQ